MRKIVSIVVVWWSIKLRDFCVRLINWRTRTLMFGNFGNTYKVIFIISMKSEFYFLFLHKNSPLDGIPTNWILYLKKFFFNPHMCGCHTLPYSNMWVRPNVIRWRTFMKEQKIKLLLLPQLCVIANNWWAEELRSKD